MRASGDWRRHGPTAMPRDLTDVIVVLSRIQGDLRAINAHHFAYPDDPKAEETIVTLVMVLQARVQEWMRGEAMMSDDADRGQQPRRRNYDRRWGERLLGLALPSFAAAGAAGMRVYHAFEAV